MDIDELFQRRCKETSNLIQLTSKQNRCHFPRTRNFQLFDLEAQLFISIYITCFVSEIKQKHVKS
jgi:hypothetical protein